MNGEERVSEVCDPVQMCQIQRSEELSNIWIVSSGEGVMEELWNIWIILSGAGVTGDLENRW